MTDLRRQSEAPPATFSLVGDVDLRTAEAIRGAASLARDRGWSELWLDLRDVTFMDSQGLSALVDARRSLQATDAALVLRNVPANVRTLLSVTGLDQVFVVDP